MDDQIKDAIHGHAAIMAEIINDVDDLMILALMLAAFVNAAYRLNCPLDTDGREEDLDDLDERWTLADENEIIRREGNR